MSDNIPFSQTSSLVHRGLLYVGSWVTWCVSRVFNHAYSAYHYAQIFLRYEQKLVQQEGQQIQYTLSMTEQFIANGLTGIAQGAAAAMMIYSGISLPALIFVSLGLLPKNTIIKLSKTLFGNSFQQVLDIQHLVNYVFLLLYWMKSPMCWLPLGIKYGADKLVGFFNSDNIQQFYQHHHIGERIWLWVGATHRVYQHVKMAEQEFKQTRVMECQHTNIKTTITDTQQCHIKWLFWQECKHTNREIVQHDVLNDTVKMGAFHSADAGQHWITDTYQEVSAAKSYREIYQDGKRVSAITVHHLPHSVTQAASSSIAMQNIFSMVAPLVAMMLMQAGLSHLFSRVSNAMTFFWYATHSMRSVAAVDTAACPSDNSAVMTEKNSLLPTTIPFLYKKKFSHEQKVFFKEVQKIPLFKTDGEKQFDLIAFEKEKIHVALLAINNQHSLRLLLKSGLKIYVATNTVMKRLSEYDGFIAGYVGTPFNEIYIHEELLKNWGVKKEEQLITALANEISHATINANHPARLNSENRNKPLGPWKNAAEKDKVIKAYQAYKNAVENYKKLLAKNSLSSVEKQQLKKYDDAMQTFIVIRMGVTSHTAVEAELVEIENNLVAITDSVNVPPATQPQARLNYLRREFFLTIQNAEIIYRYQHRNREGLYRHGQDQLYADLISDFESISPSMRQTFGPELCQLLDEFFNRNDHCVRPWWPSMG